MRVMVIREACLFLGAGVAAASPTQDPDV